MRYTVIAEKPAESQLMRLWMRAADQQAVTDASDRIDRELANDPDTKGVPFGFLRTYVDDPLAVLYHVDSGNCMVRIVQYRLTK
jgi:hypothetical protein